DGDNSAGIVFWSDDDNMMLARIVSNGEFTVDRYVNHRWLKPVNARPSDVINTKIGESNQLRLVIQGNLFTFYVNGQQAVTARGFPPAGPSEIGLWVQAEKSSTWQFSDFKVLKAPAPTTATSPATDANVLFADDFSTLDPAWNSDSSLEIK